MKFMIICCLLLHTVVSCNTALNRLQTDALIQMIEEDDPPANPVQIDLYYEAMCPGCKFFFQTQLYPAFIKFQGTGVLSIGLYPYGNAHEAKGPDGTWNYTCQHGALECKANLIEACIMYEAKNNPDVYFPVINCIESSSNPERATKGCMAALAGFSKQQIKDVYSCAKGKKGNELMHDIAVATENLSPSHQYVPWIVMDGTHTDDIENKAMADLTALVCETYKGPAPRVCQK